MAVNVRVANNAFGQLASSVSTSDTTISLEIGNAERFPTLTGSQYFYATMVNSANQLEIVKVTAVDADNFTVLRAQDGTTAKEFDAGDRIELRPVAALFEDYIEGAIEEVQDSLGTMADQNANDVAITGGTVNATIAYDNNTSGLTATDVQAAIDEVEAGKVAKTSDTGAALLPVGTTAQRPASPESGMIRFNTDLGFIEGYDPTADEWRGVSQISGSVIATGGTVTDITQDGIQYRVHTFTSDGAFEVTRGGEVEYLVVAGGGGGGGDRAGGGGAGGLIESNQAVTNQSYFVVVGNGGNGGDSFGTGASGGNSEIFSVVAIGGGGGGTAGVLGASGGSGGGGGSTNSEVAGGTGTANQGFDGGSASANTGKGGRGGGGGGAGQAGATGVDSGNGGGGVTSSITGTAVARAGGGGGGQDTSGTAGVGVAGGGNGGVGITNEGRTSGTANTGGGGGGGGGERGVLSAPGGGGDGGSGIVIVRYRIG